MKYWTREHAALLSALRAGAIVPPLVRRLSLERVSPDDAEIRRLRGWASSLRRDPGWQPISDMLDNPAAWPRVWDDAVAAGFAPETDHHHALLFARFSDRFATAEDWESAAWTWRQSVEAWARVFATEYPRRLFDDLAPKLSDEGPNREEMLRGMLDRLVDERTRDLREGSGVSRPGGSPEVQRRRLRFAWRALAQFGDMRDTADPHGTLERLDRLSTEARATVSAEVLGRFEKLVDEIDLSSASGDGLLAPFRWVGLYFEIVGRSEAAVTTVVSLVVESCWGLRRVGRDSIPEFKTLIEIGDAFNRELFTRLLSFDSAFGHNSRCADFLVFVGEAQTNTEEREATFRSGLEVCPGHRNSAMLLSYELLSRAKKLLAQTNLTPAVVARVPGSGKQVRGLVRDAARLVDEAEKVYPYNETLPDVRKTLQSEAERLHVEIAEEG